MSEREGKRWRKGRWGRREGRKEKIVVERKELLEVKGRREREISEGEGEDKEGLPLKEEWRRRKKGRGH